MANLSQLTHFDLPGIDRVPFGMRACHYYRNHDELVTVLLPYLVWPAQHRALPMGD